MKSKKRGIKRKIFIFFTSVVIFILLIYKTEIVQSAACWCVGPGGCPAGWYYGGGEKYCSPGLRCCNESGYINPGYGGFIENSNKNIITIQKPNLVVENNFSFNPKGQAFLVNCSSEIRGWTCDPDDYSQDLDIHVYTDGPAGSGKFIGAYKANIEYIDLRNTTSQNCGGNTKKAFFVPLSKFEYRAKTRQQLYVYAINHGQGNNVLLNNSPLNLNLDNCPRGYFDAFSCSHLYGWACDPNDPSKNIELHFYANSYPGSSTAEFIGSYKTNMESEKAVNEICGGGNTHRFNIPLPEKLLNKNGEISVSAYGINLGPGDNSLLLESPKKLNLNQCRSMQVVENNFSFNPKGQAFLVNCSSEIRGWTCDPDDYSQDLDIHVYADGPAGSGKLIGAYKANIDDIGLRDTASQNCGGNTKKAFFVPLSKFEYRAKTGQQLYVYAINHGQGNNVLLNNSPLNLNLDNCPRGYFDAFSCSHLYGWACDPNDQNKNIELHFYANSYPGSSTAEFIGSYKTNLESEKAVNEICGGGNTHRFNIPLPEKLLNKNGEISVSAYGINLGPGDNSLLLESPKKLDLNQCRSMQNANSISDNQSNSQQNTQQSNTGNNSNNSTNQNINTNINTNKNENTCKKYDYNSDGFVNIIDFAEFVNLYIKKLVSILDFSNFVIFYNTKC